MPRITATEFQQNVGAYSDAAQREPVIITHHNRDRLVLMSAEAYARLQAFEAAEEAALIEARMAAQRVTVEKLARR